MTTLVPIGTDRANLPAPQAMRDRIAAGNALSHNYSDGVIDSFPRLSIKGKVFSARAEGKHEVLRDPVSGHPLPYLDVVLVNASPSLAKTFYAKGFVEGDMNPPDCWSLDSVRPDPSVLRPVNPTCQNCPNNAFGSRVTPDGKAAKACADSRRVAVTLPHMLQMQEPMVFLMRIPQSSLKNLKGYVEGKLMYNGFEPGGCVTRLSFDYQASFPKLQFEYVGPLTDQEFAAVVERAESPFIASMLRAPDFDSAASAVPQGLPDTAPVQPMARQAAPVMGFGAGDLSQPIHQSPMPQYTQQAQPTPQHAPPPAQPPATPEPPPPVPPLAAQGTMRLPTGELIDLATGEFIDEPEEVQEVDPEVIKIADGRFFHRGKGAFVASEFKGAGPASATPATAKAEPVKRGPRKPKVDAQPGNGHAPAATPAPVQEAAPVENPAAPQMQANPGVTEPPKQVVAASPRLEALIKQMQPKKAN